MVLSHLPPGRGSNVLAQLPAELQADVASRIATMESTPPEVLERVERILRRRLGDLLASDDTPAGGAAVLAKILANADRETERALDRALRLSADHGRGRLAVLEQDERRDRGDPVALLELLLHIDVDLHELQLGLPLATDDLQQPVLLDALVLHGDDALAVLLRDGDLAYLHVHPDTTTAVGEIPFVAEFPSAGRYRLYLQFQTGGQVHTAPMTVEVTR